MFILNTFMKCSFILFMKKIKGKNCCCHFISFHFTSQLDMFVAQIDACLPHLNQRGVDCIPDFQLYHQVYCKKTGFKPVLVYISVFMLQQPMVTISRLNHYKPYR